MQYSDLLISFVFFFKYIFHIYTFICSYYIYYSFWYIGRYNQNFRLFSDNYGQSDWKYFDNSIYLAIIQLLISFDASDRCYFHSKAQWHTGYLNMNMLTNSVGKIRIKTIESFDSCTPFYSLDSPMKNQYPNNKHLWLNLSCNWLCSKS